MAEFIRVQFDNVNSLYLKTRWGTWLEAAFYYCNYFDQISSVVDQFHEDDAECNRKAKSIFQDKTIKVNLAFITSRVLLNFRQVDFH